MFSQCLRVAVRNLFRYKGYYILNIAGLAIGMAACAFIFLWVSNEVGYDRFHANKDHIYRVTNRLRIGNLDRSTPTTMAPAGPTMVEEIPGVVAATRFNVAGELRVKRGENRYKEKNAYYADNSVFQVFSFRLLEGDPQSALKAPYSAVITRGVGRRYFGDKNPIGKTLNIDGQNEFAVTGILDDVPANSHLNFDLLLSFETLYAQSPEVMGMWNRLAYFTYLLLAENADPRRVEQAGQVMVNKYMGELLRSRGATQELFLQPLSDIHLRSRYEGDPFAAGNIRYVYFFSALALFILAVACLNFVNLMTARSATRAREVAVRKTFGGSRRQLAAQCLGETVTLCVLAMILGLGLTIAGSPLFTSLTGQPLPVVRVLNPVFLLGFFATAVVVGLLAGIYPALYLSSFDPVRVMRGQGLARPSSGIFRRTLTVGQFVISVGLLIGTLVVREQLKYLTNHDYGFDKKNVLVITGTGTSGMPSIEAMKQEFGRIEGVDGVTAASALPGQGFMIASMIPEGFNENQAQMASIITADRDYARVLRMEIVRGRDFDQRLESDLGSAIIVNETAARQFGWDNPVGKTVRFRKRAPGDPDFTTKEVVGVVKDFHMESLHSMISPCVIECSQNGLSTLGIRIRPGHRRQALAALGPKWSAMAPDAPFDYTFLDESLQALYGNEKRLANLTLCFSLIAMIIACLGLLGVSAFSAERRAREVAVRRVLGASTGGVVVLLCREILLLAVVGSIIAWPLTYFAMTKWLGAYAYKMALGWSVFAVATIVSLAVGLMTVGAISFRAAVADPVETLRCE